MTEPVLITDLGTKYPTEESKYKKRYGLYQCHCGNIFEAMTQHIKTRINQHCGCIPMRSNHSSYHGMTGTRLYYILDTMIARTSNPKHDAYKYYGARGIKVCDEWLNDRGTFFTWAEANGYEDNLTIDRIENDGNYEPGNCKWSTMKEQCQNRRPMYTA